MADRLFLSYKLRGFTVNNMLRHYERLLRTFPESRLSGGTSVLRIHAVSDMEPVLFEKSYEDPPDIDAIIAAAREFVAADTALYFESHWDLWQYDREWKLLPSPVALACFGPEFERQESVDVEIDLVIDTHFLPQTDLPNSLFMARSNIRSVLQLAAELDRTLPAKSRKLWTESGENFADRLRGLLGGSEFETRPPDEEE
jgi:hypothetical protein